MELNIRLATLDDAKDITEVHCSDVEKWVRVKNNEKVEARYEELTIAERYAHGGPWMSIETCAIHLNYLLLAKQYPIVAEIDGKVVGELEVYVGEEKGLLGKTAFIDVMVIHKDYRRRGIGREMIAFVRELAIKHECNTLSVWPEKDAVPFYEKCGLDKIAYEIIHATINLEEIPYRSTKFEPQDFPKSYDTLKGKHFISPRIYSGFAIWLKNGWKFATINDNGVYDAGCVPKFDAAYVIESLWHKKKEARLLLWLGNIETFPRVLEELCIRARKLGISELHVLIEKGLYDTIKNLPHRKIGQEVVLFKTL